MARTEQLMWIPGYLDDIESDLSRFHRVDDWSTLPGPRFIALCERLAAYGGCVTHLFAQAFQAAPAAAEPAAEDVQGLATMTSAGELHGFPGIEFAGS